MDNVESAPVETHADGMTDLAKAMMGAGQETAPQDPPAAEPEKATPEAEPVQAATDDDEAPETDPAPDTIKGLSETTGLSAAELYAVKVTMPDGTEMSLSQLKDGHQDSAALTTERDALSERRIAFDTEVGARQTEFNDFEAATEGSWSPEQQQAAARFKQERNARESAALIATTPEWKDPVQREVDRGLMVEHVAKFGMSEAELNSLTSHKLVRIIREAAKGAQKVAKTPPKGQKPTAKPTTPRNDLKTIVSEAQSGKRTQRQALGDVLRAQG